MPNTAEQLTSGQRRCLATIVHCPGIDQETLRIKAIVGPFTVRSLIRRGLVVIRNGRFYAADVERIEPAND